MRFEVIQKAKIKVVTDALHGAGAGYLDKALADHGIAVTARRTERDCLFGGSGPDVDEKNLAPLGKAVKENGAKVGLATDGDADRFGIVDGDGTWIQPNLILALVYDYLVETRGWKMAAARSVATTQMVDAAAKAHGQTTYQTPVGFKYIGQLIREDKIALGGEESAGLTIRGHVPEKDGILACLLVAEMTAARGRVDRRAGAGDVQEIGAGVSSGAGESASVRRTEGKRDTEGGGGRYDTTGKESCIGGPHGWSKIRVWRWKLDVVAVERDGTAVAFVCGSGKRSSNG